MQFCSVGSGIEHAEGGGTPAGVVAEGFPLWINVPSERKMDAPRYGTVGPEALPVVPLAGGASARVLSGEIAILLDYDFNAYRAKYKDKANVEFVIPAEGSVVVPYVMSLVNKGPNADNGRKVLDFVLSDEGQAIWANAYLRPVRASAIPKEVQARFLPASEYARARTVDYGKMAEVQKAFSDRYLKEVR
jgi:putative spermidine/putrescine transport system substrate-binding protein